MIEGVCGTDLPPRRVSCKGCRHMRSDWRRKVAPRDASGNARRLARMRCGWSAIFVTLPLSATGSFVVAAEVTATTRAAEPSVRVVVDPRVELFSILFRLAGNPEYSQEVIPSYVKDVEAQFGKYRNHPAVVTARNLRHTRGVAFDAPMTLAVHVADAFTLRELTPFDPRPESLDPRWSVAGARDILDKLRDFAKDADFAAFLHAHQDLYALTVARMQDLLRREGHIEWFGQFFGTRPRARFTVALALLNDGGSYGPHCRTAEGVDELYCILGVWKTDRQGLPRFDREALPIVIHEFCHSFANPLVDRHMAALRPAGERIYPHVAAEMRKQAYGHWKSMMYESLVRACVVRHTLRYAGAKAAAAEIDEQRKRSFLWTQDLSDVLGEYEARRDRHATLDAFMPRIIAVLNEYAEELARRQEAAAGAEPKIVSMTPANHAGNVDPDLSAIRITFDRPMKDGPWRLAGGGPHFPEVTSPPTYDSRRRLLVIPVRLKPLWDYEFRLNSDGAAEIQSEKGEPLPPLHVKFRTGEGRGWERD